MTLVILLVIRLNYNLFLKNPMQHWSKIQCLLQLSWTICRRETVYTRDTILCGLFQRQKFWNGCVVRQEKTIFVSVLFRWYSILLSACLVDCPDTDQVDSLGRRIALLTGHQVLLVYHLYHVFLHKFIGRRCNSNQMGIIQPLNIVSNYRLTFIHSLLFRPHQYCTHENTSCPHNAWEISNTPSGSDAHIFFLTLHFL